MNKTIKGFTLIELILYISLIVIIFSALIPFVFNVVTVGEKNTTQSEVVSNARFVTEKIKREIRYANGINESTSNFGTNLSSNPSLQLSLVGSGTNDPIIINVNNGVAQIKYGAQAAVALNSSDIQITQLILLNNTSADKKTKNVSLNITVSYRNTGGRQEYQDSINFQTSVELRNN